MKTININDSIGGFTLNVHFQEKFCYLDNASGTGKSFLFRLLRRYYTFADIEAFIWMRNNIQQCFRTAAQIILS